MSSLTTFKVAEDADPFDFVGFAQERRPVDDLGRLRAPLLAPGLPRRAAWRSAFLVDALAVGAVMILVAAVQAATHGGVARSGAAHELWWLLACLPVLVASLSASRTRYSRSVTTSAAQQIHQTAVPLAAATLVCIAAWRAVGTVTQLTTPPETALLWTAGVGTLVVALTRMAGRAPGRLGTQAARRVVLVGSGAVADRLAEQLEATGRVQVVGFVDDEPKDPTGCLGSLDELASVCADQSVDHVVVAFSRSQAEHIVEALRPLQGILPISVVPRLFDVLPSTADTHDLVSGFPVVSVAPSAASTWHRAAKRTLDVVGASLALLVAFPALLVAAVGVRMTSPGPVFLRQVRVGKNGRAFTIWKLRTFTVTESVPPPEVLASGDLVTGPFPKLKNDPRMTPFGGMLRRFSIDELPQVFNVISGSMSLVGPRPLAPDYAWNFGTWALRRYDVKPGLTGLWQVSGRNDLTYEEMCRLDSLYVTCWSLGLDARILFRTARAVLGGRGCY